VGTNKGVKNAQARTQVQAYLRRLLGSNGQTGGWGGTNSIHLAIPKGSKTSGTSGTPRSLPRQLEATAYARSSKKASSGSSSAGNAWLISPIASTVKSILSLFGGGSSSAQTTRYRTTSRQTFRIVESISPETGSGTQSLNESAAALTGATSHPLTVGNASLNQRTSTGVTVTSYSGGSTPQFEDRQALLSALRRSLSESRGISDVLSEFQDGL
jgi:hypothetical protein